MDFYTIPHLFDTIVLNELVEWILVINSQLLSSFTTILVFGILIVGWYYLFYKPYDAYKDLTEIGFDVVNHSKKNYYKTDSARRDAINDLKRRRKIGDIPPPYPNGWFVILESDDLGKNGVTEVNVLGLNLVAWRGESGKSYVADAYCPHLGAHLGVGGKVQGECIRCPFHGWTFKGCDGHLNSIPYSDNVPEFAKIKIWNTIEGNGFIYLWFHAKGEKPTWMPHIYPEIESGIWKYRGRSETHAACHIQDIRENGADTAHLNFVHEEAVMNGKEPEYSSLRWKFVKYVWNATWEKCELKGEKHISVSKIHNEMVIFGNILLKATDAVTTMIGPGIVVLEFQLGFGRNILFNMVTPIDAMHQRIIQRYYSNDAIIHPLAKLVLWMETVMFDRDLRIWNRKAYMKNPILTKEDRKIKEFRQWFSQFYSENDAKSYFVKNGSADILNF